MSTPFTRSTRLANAPMTNWQKRCAKLTQAEAIALSDQAAVLAVRYARLSSYVSRLRLTGGKHDDAVKAQNRTGRATRQALGYTYADDAITF